MAQISNEERTRRQRTNASVIGTHAIEGLELDAVTRKLMQRYEEGELTGEQLSAALHEHALSLVAKESPIEQVA